MRNSNTFQLLSYELRDLQSSTTIPFFAFSSISVLLVWYCVETSSTVMQLCTYVHTHTEMQPYLVPDDAKW